jgi:hypothetical protein
MELCRGNMEPASSLAQKAKRVRPGNESPAHSFGEKAIGVKNKGGSPEPALYRGIGGGKPCFRL